MAACAAAVAAALAGAAPGDLDPAFGTNGGVHTDFAGGTDQAFAAALDGQGRLVVGGEGGTATTFPFEAEIARYDGAGNLDPTFGTGGKERLTLAPASSDFLALGMEADGKIVGVGQASDDGNTDYGFIIRLNADGTPDATFGVDGELAVPASYSLDGLLFQPDGKLVVTGFTPLGTFIVERYQAGTSVLDPSFGTAGVATTDFGGSGGYAEALALQADGKLVVGGAVPVSADADGFGVARFTASGQLDPSFGGTGYVSTAFANSSGDLASLAVQPDGRIVAAGEMGDFTSDVIPASNMALARYNADGSLDSSFGSGGTVNLNLGQESPGVNSNENIRAMALQPDGKIIGIGSHSDDGNSTPQMQVARFTTSGALDPNFGSGGLARGSIQGDEASFGGLLQPDGKIVAVGFSSGPAGPAVDFGVMRFVGGGLSPVAQLQALRSAIAAAPVNHGQQTRFVVSLDKIVALVQAGETDAASAALDQFIRDVRNQAGHTVPAAAAAAWIAQAQQIRASLQE